jgi:hypothetical protein
MTQDIKSRVKKLLVNFPELRDDDFKLIATYYSYESGGWESLKKVSAYDFLINFANHRYTSFESIRRVRCRLQEKEQELRGQKYEERKKLEQKIKEEIKTL